jgi:hypothetical protein
VIDPAAADQQVEARIEYPSPTGPFPVTTDSGTTRAHDLTPGSLFRACGDIPQPLSVPGERSEICTQYH